MPGDDWGYRIAVGHRSVLADSGPRTDIIPRIRVNDLAIMLPERSVRYRVLDLTRVIAQSVRPTAGVEEAT